MASYIKLFVIFIGIFQCNGVSWRRQLEHIANTRLENEGIIFNPSPSRRFYQFDPRELSSIIGVPSRASHLPEAEPIQPGHTLLRPALGMLKSALKFPHRELEDGSGVYGNMDNLGLKYDSRNERLMYSGFRRSPSDYIMVIPASSQDKYEKPRFKLKAAVLNLDRKAKAKNEILKILKNLNIPALKGVKVFLAPENGNYLESVVRSSEKDSSYYLDVSKEFATGPRWYSYATVYELLHPKHVFFNENKEMLRTNQNGPDKRNQKQAPEKSIASKSVEEREKNPDRHSEKREKKNWLNSMDKFDHIQIMQEAPEIDEFIPMVDDENIRKWWFYNGDDYQPFSRERHR